MQEIQYGVPWSSVLHVRPIPLKLCTDYATRSVKKANCIFFAHETAIYHTNTQCTPIKRNLWNHQ